MSRLVAYKASRVLAALRRLGGEGEDVVPPISISVVYKFTGEPPPEPHLEQKYGRENNPTTRLLEEALAAAEESDWCLAFNSGMAALSGLLDALAAQGRRRLVASRLLYGTTRGLLERLSSRGALELRYAGPPWDELLDAASEADIILVETIGNPTLRVPPLPELSRRCEDAGCILVVDNTFASPVLYQPSLLGDHVVVVESLTKYIAGHNDVLGGVACGRDPALHRDLWDTRRVTGTILQPLDAYLAARGLKTLHLRVPYSSRAAKQLAERLAENPHVERVHYPGLPGHPDHETARRLLPGLYGGVVAVELRGGQRAALRALRELRLAAASPSLGGAETLVAYPYESSHRGLPEEEKRRLGITPGLLRISVGLEDPEDIARDIEEAIKKAHEA